MAGYFYYLGRVFTEKGSWYKILTIVALQASMVYFNPNSMLSGASAGQAPALNLPAILLYILASWLIFGFSLQVYSNSLNNGRNMLPDLDFGGMFVSALRFIPFSIVWAVYIVLFAVFVSLLASALRSAVFLAIILTVLVLLFLVITLPVIMALHAKSFSYKNVLNPLTPFRVFSRVAVPIALLDLTIALVSLLLYGLIIGGVLLIGFSGGLSSGAETDPITAVTLILLFVIFFYVQNAMGFAYSLSLCDIIKSRLADTEYLDDEYPSDMEDVDDDNDEY